MTVEFIQIPPTGRESAVLRAPLTGNDVAAIREHGCGVNVLGIPAGESSLEFLAPLSSFLTRLVVTSHGVKDARFVEQMRELRELTIVSETKFDVDVTKVPGLVRFGGESRHLKYAVVHPTIRELFLESFPLSEVPFISAPVETLRINNARKLTSLPALASPGTLIELRVDSARRLSVARAADYPNLEWLLLDSCREVVDVEAVTRAPNLKKLTLADCVNLDDIDALLRLRNVEIRIAGRHPFSEEFRERAALTESAWIFPPGRRYYIPPEKRKPGARTAKLYLIHPGLARPLTVPDEAGEDTPWQDALTEEWEELDEHERARTLTTFLARVLKWARAEGADRIEVPVPPYGEDDVAITPLTDQIGEDLSAELMSLSAFSVLAGDKELAKVWETVEDGVIVLSNGPTTI